MTIITIFKSPFSKVRKIIFPFFTNLNSPFTIILIILAVFVITSLFHSMPNSVESIITMIMFCILFVTHYQFSRMQTTT